MSVAVRALAGALALLASTSAAAVEGGETIFACALKQVNAANPGRPFNQDAEHHVGDAVLILGEYTADESVLSSGNWEPIAQGNFRLEDFADVLKGEARKAAAMRAEQPAPITNSATFSSLYEDGTEKITFLLIDVGDNNQAGLVFDNRQASAGDTVSYRFDGPCWLFSSVSERSRFINDAAGEAGQ